MRIASPIAAAAVVLSACSVESRTFRPPVCGNGLIEPGEVCDDGNPLNLDGCRDDCTATIQSYLKASNTGREDAAGWAIALSADGSTLAVGAPYEASSATGIDGDQTDDSAELAGAVYVFTRVGTTWRHQAYIKASNTDSGDFFGGTVALSADGSTLAVGANHEDSGTIGIDRDQSDDSASSAGAVYVFTRSGTAWSQQAYVKPSNTDPGDRFGVSVALSGDGATLAVASYNEASRVTGIDGNQSDNAAPGAGAVYVFTRGGAAWSQQAYVKASNTGKDDHFGVGLALSADGATLAVGAALEASAATGIGGNQSDDSAAAAGAVYVFVRSGAIWTQEQYIKASNTGAGDSFGNGLALSADGSVLAVNAPYEDSVAPGIDGDPFDNSAADSGAVYVFTRLGLGWSQQAYVKASNTAAGDSFGGSVALSGDGTILAVGALGEDSAATGIGGDQSDDSTMESGAVYVFAHTDPTWRQQAYVKAPNTGEVDLFGIVALSGDGSVLAVSAHQEDGASTGVDGDQANDAAPGAGAVYVYQ